MGLGDSENERLVETLLSEIEQPEERAAVESVLAGTDSIALPGALCAEDVPAEKAPGETESGGSLYNLIKDMKLPQKIKLALFGNQTARTLLIRDSNKQVQLFVLQNGKITEGEIADIARSTGVHDLVYRMIAGNQLWMKNYSVRVNIVSNARVPIAISLKWIRYLHDRDLKRLAKSKDVPQVVANQCQKLLEKK